MKQSLRGFFHLLLGVFLLLIPFSTAVEGIQTQSGPALDFHGISHTALGRAELELVDDNLIVSNIGPGGLDGVFVDLSQITSFRMEWQDLIESGASTTTLLNFVTFGSVRGTDEILSAMFIEATQRDVRTPTLFIETDFNNIGARGDSIEVYNNGNLVEKINGEVAFALAQPTRGTHAAWPSAITIMGGLDQPLTYVLEWDDSMGDVNFIFRIRDNFQRFGNELRLIAANALPILNLSGTEVRVGDLPEFTILSEETE